MAQIFTEKTSKIYIRYLKKDLGLSFTRSRPIE